MLAEIQWKCRPTQSKSNSPAFAMLRLFLWPALAAFFLYAIIATNGAKSIPTSMTALRPVREASDEELEVELGDVEGEVEVGPDEEVVELSVATLDEEVVEAIEEDVGDESVEDAIDDIIEAAEEVTAEEFVSWALWA